MVSLMKFNLVQRQARRAVWGSQARFSLKTACLAAALASGLCTSGLSLAAQPAEWAPGRLLIMPRAGLSTAEFDSLLKVHGGVAKRVGGSNLHVVQLPAGRSETAVLAQLARHPHLKFAELDRRVPSALVANDPYLGSEWHIAKISGAAAWDKALGTGVTIAIVDSGVMPNHPDLVQVPGWNFVDGTADTTDVRGHGTGVAGTAAAIANNGAGVAGVAGGAKVMPVRVSDSTGYAYFSTIATGITYAADKGARVVNASFGSLYSCAAVQSAGQYLKSKGGLLVVSAGNSGVDDGALATDTMIPVSATDVDDAKASWSSFGKYVAVSAPGVGIWTTAYNGGYTSMSGTSFSAPMAAGVIALMMSANPGLSAGQVQNLLFATATDLGTAGRDIYFGYGRINAAAAVDAALAAVAVDAQAPSVAIAAPLDGSAVSGLVAVDVTASDNVGVTRVDLRVNGSTVASDTVAPFQFAWDSSKVANGPATVVAVAYDAAGNGKTSTSVVVNVANAVPIDTVPPVVTIANPVAGSLVRGTVSVTVSGSDNAGAAGLTQTLYLDGAVVATGAGGSLSYSWNTRKSSVGSHTLKVVAKDAAGNTATNSVVVSK